MAQDRPGYAAHLNVALVVNGTDNRCRAGAAACVVDIAAASLIANDTSGYAVRMSSLNLSFSSSRLLEKRISNGNAST